MIVTCCQWLENDRGPFSHILQRYKAGIARLLNSLLQELKKIKCSYGGPFSAIIALLADGDGDGDGENSTDLAYSLANSARYIGPTARMALTGFLKLNKTAFNT